VSAMTQPPREPAGRPGTFTSLRCRNYRLLWLGQSAPAGALWMEQIAHPWLVLVMTGDAAAHVGGGVAMRTVPQLVFGVWAGVIADRFDRRMIPQRCCSPAPVVAVMGVVLIAFALATMLPGAAGVVVPFIVVTATGALQTAYMSLANATLIMASPEAMRRRVISLISFDRAMVTAGASVGGLLAAAQGVQFAQVTYSVVCQAWGLVVLAGARGLRDYVVTDEEEEPAGPVSVTDRRPALAGAGAGRAPSRAEEVRG